MATVSFDALGLWVYLSDLRQAEAGVVVLPVAWPQVRRGRLSTTETPPADEPSGTLTVEGVESIRRPPEDGGWEPLSVWTRDPEGITLIGNTEVRFVGARLEATLTLHDRPDKA